MNMALGEAQLADAVRLREAGLGFIASAQPHGFLYPEIFPGSSKSSCRGWNHPVCAELLCPVEHYATYKVDPQR